MNDDLPLEFELHGYVDGALDDEAMARVEKHLQEHPETAAKVREYLQQKSHIRAYAQIPEATAPVPEIDKLQRQLARRLKRQTLFRWPRVAVVALVFVAGWLGHVAYLPLFESPRFTDEVIQAHMLATTTPLQATQISTDALTALFSRIDEEQRLPDLRSIGLEPVAAQLLPSERGAMLHIAYRNSAGTIISYFLLHEEEEAYTPRHILRRNGITMAYWQYERSRFALAGPLPGGQLERIAEHITPSADEL